MADPSPRRPPPWRRLAIVLVSVGIVAVAIALFTGQGDDSTDAAGASRIEFERFEGGETSLAAYLGRPVVVNFFASWCRPCIQEMPGIERIHQQYGDHVAFVGLNVNDPIKEGREVARRTGVTYDLGRDPRGELLDALGGEVMPVTVLLDADGEVAGVENGAVSERELSDLVRDKLLS